MIAKKSPLKWERFGILKWELNFIQPENPRGKISPKKLFEEYQIDIDFHHTNVQEHLLQVLLSVGINDLEEPKPGYRILIESVGVFNLSDVLELDEELRQNLKIFATTNLMIGRVRGLIPTLSSQAPFGVYQLPSIDLNDLIKQKSEGYSPDIDPKFASRGKDEQTD